MIDPSRVEALLERCDREDAHVPPSRRFLYTSEIRRLLGVEQKLPAPWPPQPGDVWRDRDGDLWFATDMNAADDPTGPCIEFVSTRGGDHEDPDEARQRWGPIGLVYRFQPGATS